MSHFHWPNFTKMRIDQIVRDEYIEKTTSISGQSDELVTLVMNGRKDTISRGTSGYIFPGFIFDKGRCMNFNDLHYSYSRCDHFNVVGYLMRFAKGKWKLKSCWGTFIKEWDTKHKRRYNGGSCVYERAMFRRILKEKGIIMNDYMDHLDRFESEFKDMPFGDIDLDDLGQLAVLIGMKCEGIPGGAAWEIYRSCFKLPLYELFEPIKWCIDFISASVKDSPLVRSPGNCGFHFASNKILCELFERKEDKDARIIFDKSMSPYATRMIY